MRNSFSEEITLLAKNNKKIVLLSGDIGNRIFDEFKKLETNAQKVDYLKELKKIKIQTPKVISMKISVKQIDKLITEWSKPVPFDKMLSEIREREEREKQIEKVKRGD